MSLCYLSIGRIYVGNAVLELLKKDGIKISKRVINTIENVLNEYICNTNLTLENGLPVLRARIPNPKEVYSKVKKVLGYG